MLEARQESMVDDIIVDKILARKGVNMSHDYRSWYPLKYPLARVKLFPSQILRKPPSFMILILKGKLKRQP
jgi:hypothetical protein